MTDLVVFDEAGALARVDGDAELLKELVSIFFEEYQTQIADLTKALADSDAKQVQAVAHSMKSALGNIGASKAAEIAKTLEYAGRAEDLSKGTESLNDLRSNVEQFSLAFKAAKLSGN